MQFSTAGSFSLSGYWRKGLLFFYLLLAAPLLVANASVISSIKPLDFITAAIADGVTDSQILLPDSASPHTYSLKPSDITRLKSAELVIWVGPDLEAFLTKIVPNLERDKQLTLSSIPAIHDLLRTEHKAGEEHENEHEHEHSATAISHEEDDHLHQHGEYDPHIWLSPVIAKQIAIVIHDRLLQHYPEKQTLLDDNLSKFVLKLAETEQIIAKKLNHVQNKGYFVFHDAYGYFEERFKLRDLGYFVLNPAIQPGAQKVYEIQQQLRNKQAVCVFREPQFDPAIINKVIAGTSVNVGVLDPLGSHIAPSKMAYFEFLQSLSQQLVDCLDSNK